MAKRGELTDREFDHNVDRYPNLSQVLTRIQQEPEIPKEGVERVEVTCLASGEATYRVWAARAEEPVGGYLGIV